MANDLRLKAHELVRAASDMISTLGNCSQWRDNVHDSYRSFTESVQAEVSRLEFDCGVVQDKASNASSVNVDGYKSEMDSFRSRFGGI